MTLNARASVTLNIDAEALENANGSLITDGTGLILVVADTASNGLTSVIAPGQSLTVGADIGVDDQILAKYSVGTGDWGDGTFEWGVNFLLTGNVAANEPVGLYWFPTLTVSTASTSAGNAYGEYLGPWHDTNVQGNQWFIPANGATVGMQFFTADASQINSGGPYPATAGRASLVVVPEPSTITLIGVGLLSAVGLMRRRRS